MTGTSAQIRPISNLAERAKRNLPENEEGEDIYASKTIIINNLKKLFFIFRWMHKFMYLWYLIINMKH